MKPLFVSSFLYITCAAAIAADRVSSCPEYPLGLTKKNAEGDVVEMIAVARTEVGPSPSLDKLKDARLMASIEAKSLLSIEAKSSTISGVMPLFECSSGKFLYVGIFQSKKSQGQASSLFDLIRQWFK